MTMSESTTLARVIIVTGLSGSGKSIAIRQLEDSGYYCLDNLPGNFLVPVVESLAQNGQKFIAVALDARSQLTLHTAGDAIDQLRQKNFDVQILFLCASTPELARRFSETRRRHPLTSAIEGQTEITLAEAIKRERELMEPVAEMGHVIDTTGLLANTLRDWVRQFAHTPEVPMMLAFESFAFKTGIPVVADLVFDVRNLPNPYYEKTLRPLTGLDQPIKDFFAQRPIVADMISDIAAFVEKWIGSYQAQNRHYLTVAIGCTGGQHRSVFVAQTLAEHFARQTATVVRHRQLSTKKSY